MFDAVINPMLFTGKDFQEFLRNPLLQGVLHLLRFPDELTEASAAVFRPALRYIDRFETIDAESCVDNILQDQIELQTGTRRSSQVVNSNLFSCGTGRDNLRLDAVTYIWATRHRIDHLRQTLEIVKLCATRWSASRPRALNHGDNVSPPRNVSFRDGVR